MIGGEMVTYHGGKVKTHLKHPQTNPSIGDYTTHLCRIQDLPSIVRMPLINQPVYFMLHVTCVFFFMASHVGS